MSIEFPQKTDLSSLQKYIQEVCIERGWDKDTAEEKFLLFVEEVGELAKAIRNQQNLYSEKGRDNKSNLEEEFADVLSYILDLANTFDVNLAEALKAKEAINAKRTWE